MASDFHFFADIFGHLNGALNTYVTDVATNIIGAIKPVSATLLAIYITLWGWTMIRGMISEPITDGITRIVRLSVIYSFALSIGTYNGFISDFLWNSPDAIAQIVAAGYSDSNSNVSFLDTLVGKIWDFGQGYWDKANASTGVLPDMGLLFTAFLIWAAGLAATAYGAFLLALSKMALAILLGIGPIFVMLLFFEGTKRFFESWLGQALNYVILVVLAASAIKLILTILQKYLDANPASGAADPSIPAALPAIAICIIAALVMTQLSSIASALGGGAAISTLGAVGWAYGKAHSKAGGMLADMRPTTMRRNLNRLKADKDITIAAAKWAVGRPSLTKASVVPKNRTGGGA